MPFKRSIFITLLVLVVQTAFAQQKDTLKYYLGGDDKPADITHAAFILKVYKEKPADELWKREYISKIDRRLRSVGSCKDSLGKIKEGEYKLFDYRGRLYKTGRYENDKAAGEWKGFYTSGKTESIYYYDNGKMTGLCRGWYENGNLKDSFDLDKGGNGYGLGFYEDGQKRYEGNFAVGIKKGEWRYYYDLPDNHQSMVCEFANDSLRSSKCFTKEGEPQNKDCNFEREAEFRGGHVAWVKYLVKKIDKSKYLNYMKVGMQYTVIVKFALDEEGSVTDVEVEDPGSSERLDNIAEDIIRQSPHWEPAIQYNQPVKAYRRQPITFVAQAQ